MFRKHDERKMMVNMCTCENCIDSHLDLMEEHRAIEEEFINAMLEGEQHPLCFLVAYKVANKLPGIKLQACQPAIN